jgi:hypothetical protein
MEEPSNDYYESDSDKSELDFLDDLGSDKFVSPPEIDKEQVKNQKQQEREIKAMVLEQERNYKRELREQKQRDAQQAKEDKKNSKNPKPKQEEKESDDIFGATPTVLLGKDRIVLLKKVSQYKSLFPAELKSFKVKKNPTVDELKDVLTEMAVLVEVGSMDEFMMSSVVSCMKLVEGASAATSYDIRGCADMLKNNPDFHRLCKVLFIKYNVFTKVPPEFQLILLVSTTAYMCSNKNRGKGALNDYLNTPL